MSKVVVNYVISLPKVKKKKKKKELTRLKT